MAVMGDHRNSHNSAAMAWVDLIWKDAEDGIPPDDVDREMLEHSISPQKVKLFLEKCTIIAAEVNASRSRLRR
jgi:hypothetical protein